MKFRGSLNPWEIIYKPVSAQSCWYVCVCICTHFPPTIIWKRVQDSKTNKTDRLRWNRQTQVGLYRIIFVSFHHCLQYPKQCLILLGTQLPVIQLIQFSSLVLYLFIALPSKWRCHESDEFFKSDFSHAHVRAPPAQPQDPAFHTVALHSLTLWKNKWDPILPFLPGN